MPDLIRIVIADDSSVVRRLLQEALARVDLLEVVGIGRDGREALDLIRTHKPDLLVVDVEMPVMDGIDTVRALRSFNTSLPVIMFSSLTETGCEATLDALAAGANDYAAKPQSSKDVCAAIDYVKRELVPKIRTLVRDRRRQAQPLPSAVASLTKRPPLAAPAKTKTCAPAAASASTLKPPTAAKRPTAECPTAPTALKKRTTGRASHVVDMVLIGTSTGGPNALADLLPMISNDIRVPILIVQHMPTVFTKLLADRLNGLTKLSVREAVDGETPVAGTILIAPGNKHMEITGSPLKPKIRLHDGPEENSCRPAVDVLFRSASKLLKDRVLGIILTGMGKDGLEGCRNLSSFGAPIIAQDEQSCVIWGMPRAVAEAGLANLILPLDEIAEAIHNHSPAIKPTVLATHA